VKELIMIIAQTLVDQPEKVAVSEVQGSQCTVFELKVDKSEIGKVIGKQGRTAQAIRTILNAAAAKIKKRMVLEILETNESPRFTHVVRRHAATL
jgi:predicted RNA-binding protein YlqC (UPF0109 family)